MKKTVLINFFVIIIFFIFAEIFTRAFNLIELQGADKNIYYTENEIILSKKNKSFKIFGKNSKTDEYGFRIPLEKFSYNKDKAFTLILGDSVTFGVGVEEKDSFVGLLRKELKKNLLNTAIMGHNVKSYSYLLEKNYSKFEKRIDKAVIFLCLNDIVSYQGVAFKEDLNKPKIKKNFTENYLKNDIFFKLNIFLREKSAFFVLLKSLITRPVQRHYEYMEILYEKENNLILFESYINKIVKFSKYNDIETEFVLLPYRHQVVNRCKKEYLKPQNKIKKIFNLLNVKLHDYTFNFCDYENNEDLFLSYDPVHLSIYGHRLVSDLVIRNNLIK